jgi:hypothetical protein
MAILRDLPRSHFAANAWLLYQYKKPEKVYRIVNGRNFEGIEVKRLEIRGHG